jgi:hypothetical protein
MGWFPGLRPGLVLSAHFGAGERRSFRTGNVPCPTMLAHGVEALVAYPMGGEGKEIIAGIVSAARSGVGMVSRHN